MDFGQLPEWTPDGRCLVFQGEPPRAPEVDRDYPRDESLLYLDRATGDVRELPRTPGATLAYPSMSPDGQWLFFVEATAKADIWMLRADDPH